MPQTDIGRRAALKLGIHALAQGAKRRTLGSVEWDIAGRCVNPVQVVLYGRQYGREVAAWDTSYNNAAWPRVMLLEPDHPMRFNVDMLVRCRRCEPCLKAKAQHWAHRAFEEIRCSPRTWFGTLTLRPEEQQRFLERARVKARKRAGVDYDVLPEPERFRLRDAEIQREITLMLKRMRKVSGLRFRYLLVSEAHQSGEPHYHMFVHEIELGSITHRSLSAQWPLGWSKWKLVDSASNSRAAWYACKYLSKGANARVRASLRYGCAPERAEIGTALCRRTGEISETSEISTCLPSVCIVPGSGDLEGSPPEALSQIGGAQPHDRLTGPGLIVFEEERKR